jgi:hypothetical protein
MLRPFVKECKARGGWCVVCCCTRC